MSAAARDRAGADFSWVTGAAASGAFAGAVVPSAIDDPRRRWNAYVGRSIGSAPDPAKSAGKASPWPRTKRAAAAPTRRSTSFPFLWTLATNAGARAAFDVQPEAIAAAAPSGPQSRKVVTPSASSVATPDIQRTASRTWR